MFKIGDKVKCKITGFEGIVTGEHSWITGCDTYSVRPNKLGKDGEYPETKNFDENQLNMVEAGAVNLSDGSSTTEVETPVKKGGPQDTPSSTSNVS
jgi:hypothetical protein